MDKKDVLCVYIYIYMYIHSRICIYIESESEVTQSCPTLRPHGLQSTRLLCPWDFPGNSPGVDCHFLLQGIFPIQGSNLGLPPCRQTLYHLSHQGSWILLSHEKEQNNAICNNMNGIIDYHTKWNKSERERQIPYDIACIWNLKRGTNEPTYEKETDSQT